MTGCAICCGDTCNNPHTLPCTHTFCAGCIVNWFRNGHNECPLCRDPCTVRSCWVDANKRAQAIMKRARCKRASARLKQKVATVRHKRAEYRAKRKALTQFKRKHKGVLSTYTKMMRQSYVAHRAWNRCKNSLGFEIFTQDEPLIHPYTTLSAALLH